MCNRYGGGWFQRGRKIVFLRCGKVNLDPEVAGLLAFSARLRIPDETHV
jgi:hypothetical protein